MQESIPKISIHKRYEEFDKQEVAEYFSIALLIYFSISLLVADFKSEDQLGTNFNVKPPVLLVILSLLLQLLT